MKSATHLTTFLVALTLLALQSRSAGQGTPVLTTLYSFKGGMDGAHPYAALVQGSDGTFYGTTYQGGGSSNAGTVFSIPPTGGMPTILHSFTDNGTDGLNPYAGLIQGRDGKGSDGTFYGTTIAGGSSNAGTVFSIPPTGGMPTILHSFTDSGTEGALPYAGLVQGSDGTFYGTTKQGGSSNAGTVFSIPLTGGMPTTLHSFTGTGTDGASPQAALVQGSDGNFYGTTRLGGSSSNDGTVFSIPLTGGMPTPLYSFTGTGTDGASPYAGLIQGSDGNFYGTTYAGGSSNAGTVFSIPLIGGMPTILHSFTGTDGSGSNATLVQGNDGNFYGTTIYGGSSDNGTVFSIPPTGGMPTTLHSFTDNGTDGLNPYAGLVQGNDGNFYGTTYAGGSSKQGTVFCLTVAPVITSATSASGTVGVAFSYQINAANGPTSYAASGLPAGLSVNTTTGLISGTPTTAGTSTVTLAASNAAGSGTATLTLTINPPPAPVITSATPPNGQVGVKYSYQIKAANNPTSFDASGLPPGLATNASTGLVSGTPSQAGTFTVSFAATNTGGTGNESYPLTILPAKPVITSPASANGQVGKAFAYQITASNSPISFSVQGLNDGLTVDTATGLITGTPPATESAHPLTINATNSGGTGGSATLTLTITDTAPVVPQITSAASASGQAGQTFAYQITGTNSPTSYGAAGLPGGLSVNTATGLISGTPTTTSSPTVSITAMNAAGTGSATLTLAIAAAPQDTSSFDFASPPSGSQLVSGNMVPIYVQVSYSSSTLQSLTLYADDLTTPGNSTTIAESNFDISQFNWTPPAPGTKADAYELRAEATNAAGVTNTFKLPITIVSSTNPVSSIQLMPDVSDKKFVAGTMVTLVPVVEDATQPINRVGVYGNGAPVGTAATKPQFVGTNRIFPPISYPVKSALALLTATVTNTNNDSSPSTAVFLHQAAAQAGQTLACAITAPAADANGAATVPSGKPLMVTAQGTNISSVEFYVDGTLVGTSTSAPFSVTVPASALATGQHTLTAIATDANGISVQAAPVTLIAQPPQPPAITSATTASATVGKAFSYQIAATNSPTSYSTSSVPPGLSFSTSKGKFTGAPTAAGTTKLTIGASNSAGTGSQSLTITVASSAAAGTLGFGTSAYSVDEHAGSITVHVLRSGGSSGTASVVCGTSGGTAKSGTDYSGLSKTLSWAAGDTAQKAFTVPITDLGITDGSTRAFTLKLSSPTGATLGSPTSATVTIKENDPKAGELAFAAASYSVAEDAGTLTVHVNRTVGSTGAVSVTCGTSGGTAKSGTDYVGISKTLSWADGDKAQKSFTVGITNRGASGGKGLKFSVVLSSPGAGAILGSPAAATITIN